MEDTTNIFSPRNQGIKKKKKGEKEREKGKRNSFVSQQSRE